MMVIGNILYLFIINKAIKISREKKYVRFYSVIISLFLISATFFDKLG